MVVRIRLARFGQKHKPIYNIVVAQARTARNSKPIEVIGTVSSPFPFVPSCLYLLNHPAFSEVRQKKLANLKISPFAGKTGTYDPIPKKPPFGDGKPFKDVQLDRSRAKYWLGVGAQPSDPVWRLLSMVCRDFFRYTGIYGEGSSS